MIKIDKTNHLIKGKGEDIMAELTLAIVLITENISKQSGDSTDEVLATILATLLTSAKMCLHTENKEDK